MCGRALEILDGARTLVKGTSPYLFPNRLGKQLEEKQLRRMLAKHKIAAVPHGFRSSFRDWAAEETNHPREVIEAALAHVVQNRVEAALSAHGPIRPPTSAHGRLGGLPGQRESRRGGWTDPLIRRDRHRCPTTIRRVPLDPGDPRLAGFRCGTPTSEVRPVTAAWWARCCTKSSRPASRTASKAANADKEKPKTKAA